MKISILGKGGSGKSTISWLLSSYLSTNLSQPVLAIDADHNMDLSANLGFEVTPSTKTILECNNNLRQILSLKENDKWFNVFSNSNLPTFSFPNLDSFSQDISYQLNSNLYLQILGLGQESLLYQDMCSHAHSAGLKFYLALLKFQPNSNLIIDGVAGTDMLNYGLYLGCNASIVSLENHINSQRVLDKILVINKSVGLPTYVVLNKYQDNQSYSKLKEKYEEYIIGKINLDNAIVDNNYASLSSQNIENLAEIVEKLSTFDELKNQNNWERLKTFQTKKLSLEKD
jgi:CO dehydrogenase maturation factor